MQDITVILGPTASGKTTLSLQIAEESGAEIISADAFQVYRGMDIGTAKVSAKIRDQIQHHLIDILEPTDTYSVADFIRLSSTVIESLRTQSKSVVICGGTAFYIHAFLYGYSLAAPASDPEFKAKLEAQLAELGPEALWNQLHQIDPPTAAAIHPNNHRRVIRALEIYHQTQIPPSQTRHKHPSPRSDCRVIGISHPRDELYARINQRVLQMIEAGLVNEVQNLLNAGIPESAPAFTAIGYKEVLAYLNGGISYDEMINLIQQHTRNFAKRQLTWIKQFEHLHWYES